MHTYFAVIIHNGVRYL